MLYRGRPSHWGYLGNYVFGGAVILGSPVLLAVPEVPELATVAVALVGVLIIALALFDRIATHFEVTSRTVSLRKGIMTREITEVPIRGIREIRLTQGIIQRLVNVGTVGFSTASTSQVEVVYRGVPDPNGLRELVKKHAAA